MISGITNYDDALSATNLGADFIAFNLVKDNPKKVSPKLLKDVNEKLPPFIWAIGVFHDEDHKFITKTVQKSALKAVCLSGFVFLCCQSALYASLCHAKRLMISLPR
mgnify:CR=1 FL=1